MEKGERSLQGLAMFVHGVLASFHALGVIYNYRRKNWQDTVIHTTVCLYDIHATHKHYKALKGG